MIDFISIARDTSVRISNKLEENTNYDSESGTFDTVQSVAFRDITLVIRL